MNASTLASSVDSLGGKYLTVDLDSESYGISVLQVLEIIRMRKPTVVPQMPDYVSGVINLRGRVIPVIDLRTRLQVRSEFSERTCIVVVRPVNPTITQRQFGLVVDCVEEVMMIGALDIEPAPDFGGSSGRSYIRGIAKVGERVRLLLDIDQVIGFEGDPNGFVSAPTMGIASGACDGMEGTS